MDLGLAGKKVLITGATSGIGMALAQAFLAEGADVCVGARGGLAKLEALMSWVRDNKISETRITSVQLDLENHESLSLRLDELFARWGVPDILINNAGYAYEFPFVETSDTEIDKLVDVNFTGTLLVSRKVLKAMLPRRSGNIVTISSASSEVAGRGIAVYASLKAALNRWTEIVSTEYCRKGLRINAVAPAVINTKMSGPVMSVAGDHVLARTPMGRIGEVREVVPAVLFLASDACASYITGQTLFVDGGMRGA